METGAAAKKEEVDTALKEKQQKKESHGIFYLFHTQKCLAWGDWIEGVGSPAINSHTLVLNLCYPYFYLSFLFLILSFLIL